MSLPGVRGGTLWRSDDALDAVLAALKRKDPAVLAVLAFILFIIAVILELVKVHLDWVIWLIIIGGACVSAEVAWGWYGRVHPRA